jgi:hypothetical protein
MRRAAADAIRNPPDLALIAHVPAATLRRAIPVALEKLVLAEELRKYYEGSLELQRREVEALELLVNLLDHWPHGLSIRGWTRVPRGRRTVTLWYSCNETSQRGAEAVDRARHHRAGMIVAK